MTTASFFPPYTFAAFRLRSIEDGRGIRDDALKLDKNLNAAALATSARSSSTRFITVYLGPDGAPKGEVDRGLWKPKLGATG